LDSFCEWNEGRWRRAGGEARRIKDEPDLRLDVSAALVRALGGFTFAELRRGSRLRSSGRGPVARADAMFPADVAPWCPEIF
jgi:hypothetical protein